MASPRPIRSVWLLASFAVIYVGWGSTFLAIRYAVASIPPFVMAGTRNLVAGVVLVGLALATGAAMPRARQWRLAAIIGGLMFVVNHGGISWASQHIPSGVTALVVATIPLWVVVIEWGLGATRRPSPRVASGLALGFLGCAALVLPGRSAGAVDPLSGLAASLGAVAWATGTVVSRRTRISESMLMAAGLPMVAGGLGLFAVAAVAGEWTAFDPGAVTLRAAGSLAYLIGVGSLLGFSAYTWLLRVAPATRVSTYAYVNPVVALAIGAAIGGEPLSAITLVAGALSLVGVFLAVSG